MVVSASRRNQHASRVRSPIRLNPRNPRLNFSVFAEEEFVDAAENFFDTNWGGKKAVATEDAAGNHLAFGPEITQRKNRRVFERRVGLNLALEILAIFADRIDEDEIGLKPMRGFQSQSVVVFFSN